MTDPTQKTSVTVRIAGEDHAIRSSVNPEHTLRCARLVEERVKEVQEKSGVSDRYRAIILAALSMADRYVRAADELEAVKAGGAHRARELYEQIEAELDDTAQPSSNVSSG